MDRATFHRVLEMGVRSNASDIHLKVGAPILFRIVGVLHEAKSPMLTAENTESVARMILDNVHPPIDVAKVHEWDGSYSLKGVSRFRVNIYRQRSTLAIILRAIPFDIPTVESLRLPTVLNEISLEERGIVLVTGVTGSGKSSTLAAMINYVNRNKKCHILTIEDPIEFIHRNDRASISQREIGQDTTDFTVALRASLRQDPDIILVGEMRDLETIRLALTAAETGHLVFGTLHTSSASKTIDRIVDVFPAAEKEMVRAMLSESLRAVISQTLLKKTGGGRIAAHEIMIGTPAIRNLIREGKIAQMYSAIQTGQASGMQTLDQNLATLMTKGLINKEEARFKAVNKENF